MHADHLLPYIANTFDQMPFNRLLGLKVTRFDEQQAEVRFDWASQLVGNPVQLSATPTVAGVVAPELGQHTEEVLLEAGFSWEDIAELRAEGAY